MRSSDSIASERSSPPRLRPAELHIALGLAEDPAHGYRLMQRVAAIGGDEVGAATMYRTLRRMLDQGLVVQADPGPGEDQRRRPYRLTDDGLWALAAEGRRMAALVGEVIVRGVPERFHTVTPQLAVCDANAAIGFYCDAFGARELVRTRHESGRVEHAELAIGDSLVLVHDDFSDLDGPGAPAPGKAGVTIHLYVPDADGMFERAIARGARSVQPITSRPWGDRYGILVDPFAHRWSIGTPRVDLPG